MLHSWVPRVVAGLVIFSLFSYLAVDEAIDASRRSGPPTAMTVDEAARRSETDVLVEHVRITDLVVDCGTQSVVQMYIYVGGAGARGADGPLVLMALDSDVTCQDGPVVLTGDVMRPEFSLVAALGLTSVSRLVLLRPYTFQPLNLIILGLAALGGIFLARSGLRRRQANRALLANLEMPEAPTDLAPDPGEPYRRAPGERWLLPGPLRLGAVWMRKQQRNMWLTAIAIVAITGFTLWWSGSALVRARQAAEIWETGVFATDVEVGGSSNIRLYGTLNDGEFVVAYTDLAGRRHTGEASRMAIGAPISDKIPPVIKLDPADPTRYALSWLVSDRTDEYLFHGILLITVLFTAGATMIASRSRRREQRRSRAIIHNSPEEHVLPVLRAEPRYVKDQIVGTDYTVRLPGGQTFDFTMDRARPLFLEIDESRLLALWHPKDPAFAVILHEDLTPLTPDPQEAERVRLRYRRGKPA